MAADPTNFDFSKPVNPEQMTNQLLMIIALCVYGQFTGNLTAGQKANITSALQAIINKLS